MNEKVYRAIKKMIAIHRFQPGLRLNAEKIARELGVSRTPVWESIRRLGQEGIVQNIPNRGVFMAETPLERVVEMIEARGVLDKFAGRMASDRISDRIVKQLDQCLPDQLRAIETADISLYSSLDFRFHGLIYEASGNSYLKELFESITLQTLPARMQILSILPLLYLDHQEIIRGLADRDPDRVEEALAHHTEIVIAHVKKLIQSANEREEMVRQIRMKVPYIGRLKKRNRVTEGKLTSRKINKQ
jgi:DNA-binding GntR family transcriptional regulator